MENNPCGPHPSIFFFKPLPKSYIITMMYLLNFILRTPAANIVRCPADSIHIFHSSSAGASVTILQRTISYWNLFVFLGTFLTNTFNK